LGQWQLAQGTLQRLEARRPPRQQLLLGTSATHRQLQAAAADIKSSAVQAAVQAGTPVLDETVGGVSVVAAATAAAVAGVADVAPLAEGAAAQAAAAVASAVVATAAELAARAAVAADPTAGSSVIPPAAVRRSCVLCPVSHA
jgi:hypothetical protein